MINVPDNIKNISPYVPGKPLEELERELGISGSIKLASNENPLGPSPKAVNAIRKALDGLNRYPDGSGFYLSQALAKNLCRCGTHTRIIAAVKRASLAS